MTQMAEANAHTHHHDMRPPKALLAACFGLVVFALIATAFVRITGIGESRDAGGVAVETLALTFADRPDGAVIARHAETGEVIKVWEPLEGGFVRTTMRALAHSRYKAGVGADPEFILVRTDSDRLLLQDPTTGKRVSLEAFGQDNEEAFAVLLEGRGDLK